jgi:cytochrome c peroxidase
MIGNTNIHTSESSTQTDRRMKAFLTLIQASMARLRGYGLVVAGILALLAGVFVFMPDPDPVSVPPIYVAPASDMAITPIPATLDLDARKVALGRRLFLDKRLSADDSIACASCHDLARAGDDGLSVAVGVGGRRGELNTPTVFNSGFNFRQFWDGRAATLEEQVPGPVHNPLEMATDWATVIRKLEADDGYRAAFREIWPDAGNLIRAETVQAAIAEFERSLLTPDSAFDRFLRGEETALDASALRGWDTFRNLGCIACHQGVNLGGNMYANLGVMGDYFAERGKPPGKGDLGRYNVTLREVDRHVFKVPSLRNVARTAPYFHDGCIASLEEAVETMARYQLGIVLAREQRADLVAFLKTLNGRLPEVTPR